MDILNAEMKLVFTRYYLIRATSGARPETPEALAARFLKNADLLRAINPLFALWISGAKGLRKLETIRRITPPRSAVIDHLPNGSLLMSATTETFDIANPAHLAVAQDIALATRPLSKVS